MEKQPVALRKVPLIAKWSPEILADLLINVFANNLHILTAYEWVEGQVARTVPPSNLQETLAGLDTAPDIYSKIALFPAHFFVWSDELETAYQTYHHHVSLRAEDKYELDPYGAFEMDPATHPYDDLLSECPDFTSNPYLTGGAPPTMRDLSKQKKRHMNARWQDRADELKKINPAMFKSDIAKRIAKEPIAEGRSAETIRKNITI